MPGKRFVHAVVPERVQVETIRNCLVVVKVSGVSDETRKVMMLELPVEETKMSIKDMTVSTWVPSITRTRTRESESANFAVSAHRRALSNNHHNSCVRGAVVV